MDLVVPLQTSSWIHRARTPAAARTGTGRPVHRVGGERKGVLGRGAAAEEQQRVACALAEVGVGGDLGGGGVGEGGGGGRWGCRRRGGGGGESGGGGAASCR